MKKYIDQINPKLIVYEVYPETFTNDGVESSLDIIANGKNDIETVKMAFQINNLKTYNTLIYAFMSQALGLNSSFKEPRQRHEDTYITGGFVARKLEYNTPQHFSESTWDIREDQLKAFQETISLLKSKDVDYLLVTSPINSTLYKSHTNNQEFDSIVSNYGTYYNFNERMQLNDSLHLTRYGPHKT